MICQLCDSGSKQVLDSTWPVRNHTTKALDASLARGGSPCHPAYKSFNNVVVVSNSFVDRVHRNQKPPQKNILLQDLIVLSLM